MSLLGWNSIDSVRRIHDIAEVTGVVLFALLVAAEAIQITYGRRERHLNTVAEKAEKAKSAPRHLTEQQRQSLVAGLTPFAGQKITIGCIMSDREGKAFAQELADVLLTSHWEFLPSNIGPDGKVGINQGMFSEDPIGIQVQVSEQDVHAGKLPIGAQPLLEELFRLNLIPEKRGYSNKGTPSGVIDIEVGRKPET